MPIPVILSKLHIPPIRANLVPRPQLLERLQQGLDRKLTLVSAPAGFGKTTLINSWLNRLPLNGTNAPQVAWVSLEESEDNPARFWLYLLTALQTIAPAICQNALALLDETELPSLEFVLTTFINDTLSLLDASRRIVLVLDDYHTLADDDIHESLAFLLDHLSPQLHLVITSRVDPPLPLARLRARNQLNELRAGDLRFTPEEATTFLNEMMGLALSPENILALETRTEGWAAGLQLAAMLMQSRTDVGGFIAGFTGSHQYVLDYLVQEVFNQQPPAVQDFLLRTAILDRLCGPLCDAITGREDGQAMLEQLAAANLFITPLDDQRQWYRYHRLFADLLRHQLQQTDLDVAELHRRASAWCEAQEIIEPAVNHALAAKDYDRVEQFILQNMKALFRQGKGSVVLDWLNALPETYLESSPLLGLPHAWLLLLNGNVNRSKQRLDQVERALARTPPDLTLLSQDHDDVSMVHITAFMTMLKAQISMIQGEPSQTIELFQQALRGLPETMTELRGALIQNLALTYWLNGDLESADQILQQAQPSAANGDKQTTLIATVNQAERHNMRGQLTKAALLYRRALQLTEGQPNHQQRALAQAELGLILYEWNELDKAETHLRAGIEGCDIMFRAIGVGYVGLAQVLRAKGDLDGAAATIEKLQTVFQTVEYGPATLFPILHLPIAVARHDVARLKELVHTYDELLSGETLPRSDLLFFYVAQAYLALNNPERVIALFNRLLENEALGKNLTIRPYARAALALAYHAQGNPAPAINELTQTLILAEPEHYLRLFIDLGQPMADLLRTFLADPATEQLPPAVPTYAQTILTAFGPLLTVPTPAAKLPPQPLVDPLTEREIEVLRLIADGYSNREIADKLVISIGTVKAHAKHLYSKLDVNSRTQAIVTAREIGLI